MTISICKKGGLAMDILNISKEKGEATVKLTADELVKLCNALYDIKEEQKDTTYWNLYNELMIACDLCQHGHIDNFCFSQIVKCREHLTVAKNSKKESVE